MSEKVSIHQDTHLKVLRLLETSPQMNQRELAQALGVSLGKTNFCLKALLDKGLLKAQSFQNSKRKLAYAYLLTPAGIAEKTSLTGRFLKRKIEEYELLKAEIESLQQETSKNATQPRGSVIARSECDAATRSFGPRDDGIDSSPPPPPSLRAQRGNPSPINP